MPFKTPMVWRKPRNHFTDCYFCLTHVPSVNTNSLRHQLVYADVFSATRPRDTEAFSTSSSQSTNNSQPNDDVIKKDPTYAGSGTQRCTQGELNDLVRELQLPKHKAEYLGSWLKQRSMLQDDVKITFRQRQESMKNYFENVNGFVTCTDIEGLMAALKIKYDTHDWRLFIDASKTSLKAVLLHNGNKYPSVPIAYSVAEKESYISMKQL